VRQAACVVVVRDDGLVLGVARSGKRVRFAFPGGGLEPGEAPVQAAARELQEETGLVARDLLPVLSLLQPSGRLFAFLAKGIRGSLRGSHEGHVAWFPPAAFTSLILIQWRPSLLKTRTQNCHRPPPLKS